MGTVISVSEVRDMKKIWRPKYKCKRWPKYITGIIYSWGEVSSTGRLIRDLCFIVGSIFIHTSIWSRYSYWWNKFWKSCWNPSTKPTPLIFFHFNVCVGFGECIPYLIPRHTFARADKRFPDDEVIPFRLEKPTSFSNYWLVSPIQLGRMMQRMDVNSIVLCKILRFLEQSRHGFTSSWSTTF